jgi:hypothetical protein
VAVATARGVADGVPGPGVFEAVGVMLGVRVGVAVPATGVLVGRGRRVGWAGAWVGGSGVMVTIGVTGRSVGEGVGVAVLVGVGGGVVGLLVWVGDAVKVLVGVLVGVVGSISNGAPPVAPSVETTSTWWVPGLDGAGAVGVVNDNCHVPSPRTWTWPKKRSELSQ